MKILNHIFFTMCLSFTVGVCNATYLFSNEDSRNEQQQLSPLELKVEALTTVVEKLLMDSKAKDKIILLETKARQDLEKRIVEMEKLLTDMKSVPEDVPETEDLNANRGSDLNSLHLNAVYSKGDKALTPQKDEMQTVVEGVEKNSKEYDLNEANEHNILHKKMDTAEQAWRLKHVIHKSKSPSLIPPFSHRICMSQE